MTAECCGDTARCGGCTADPPFVVEYGVQYETAGETFTTGGWREAGARQQAAVMTGKGWSHSARVVRRMVGPWQAADEATMGETA